MTLVEFLLARIAEDERVIIAPRSEQARHMAECEAKRRIVELHCSEWISNGDTAAEVCRECRGVYPCETLDILALVYADHPDYDESWRP